jgi:hypothetical protein
MGLDRIRPGRSGHKQAEFEIRVGRRMKAGTPIRSDVLRAGRVGPRK